MELNDNQKQTVAEWVRKGDGLSEIQRRIKNEFDITMTYMDVRFLVLDLGVNVKDKYVPAPPKPAAVAPSPESYPDEDSPYDTEPGAPQGSHADPYPEPEEAYAGGLPANVSVDVDRLVKPGALVSGSVVFSDGVSAKWSLDQYGRLALQSAVANYKPSESDVQAFQMELRRALETRGF